MPFLKTLLLSFLLLVVGCSDEEAKITEIDNPELVAIAFFDALYNERDLAKAASVCEPKLARIILHYKSPRAVARHLFNMSYDKVEIRPDSSGVKVREQFKNSAVIIMYFDGYYNGDRIKDIKKISLVQIGDHWVIDKLMKDPF